MLDEWAAITTIPRKDMTEIIIRMKIARELKHAVSNEANHIYKSGNEVSVWHEVVVNNRIEEWLGPFEI